MTYTPPFQIVRKPSSFPNAFTRTFAPKVLQVVHVTGNSSVAALPDGLTAGHSPYQDWLYAARNPQSADGPSAHNYAGRRGSTIEMWSPVTHVAWSNGDLEKPNLNLAGVRYLADLRARGINANRGCYREIELSGYPGSFDPTDEQIEVCAYFAAIDSIATGLDIIRGETMLTHGDINSVDRANCAFRPAIREARMAEICARGVAIRDLLRGDPMSIYVRKDNPGRFTIPAGKAVRGWQPDGTGWRVVKTWTAATAASSGPYDYHLGRVSGTASPSSLLHVPAGFFAGLFISTADVEETADPPPVLDCSQAVADAKAAQHEVTRAKAIAAVSAL